MGVFYWDGQWVHWGFLAQLWGPSLCYTAEGKPEVDGGHLSRCVNFFGKPRVAKSLLFRAIVLTCIIEFNACHDNPSVVLLTCSACLSSWTVDWNVNKPVVGVAARLLSNVKQQNTFRWLP